MIRHLVGLHPGAAAWQLIINFRYRLLRGAALHHAAVNISFATPSTLFHFWSLIYPGADAINRVHTTGYSISIASP